MSKFLIPIIIFALFLYGIIKKQPLYDYFVEGAKGAIPLIMTVFPYVACIAILIELLFQSGLTKYLDSLLSPALKFLGIPNGIFELIIFRPFSGSGSIAILEKIFSTYGADSYEARCASVISGSSETIFYLSAIFFSSNGIKKLRGAILISCISTFFTVIFSCLICKVM